MTIPNRTRTTISTFQLFEMFPDQETALVYLERRLWPKGYDSNVKRGKVQGAAP